MPEAFDIRRNEENLERCSCEIVPHEIVPHVDTSLHVLLLNILSR